MKTNRYLSWSLLLFLNIIASAVFADNITEILHSKDYYVGTGTAKTEAEADQRALADMCSQIAVHVANDFKLINEEVNTNGNINSKSTVLDCIKTYSGTTVTNSEKWVEGKEPEITVYRYMKRSELSRIYENRIEYAKDMLKTAENQLEKGHVDMALKNYYWASALIRSVQFPYEVKDTVDGSVIIGKIPEIITNILRKVTVKYDSQEGTDVNLLFYYDGKPVSYLDFSYNDGTEWNTDCKAQDGHGMIVMQDGYENKKQFDICIEYEYKNRTMGDNELNSVLNLISKRYYPESLKKVTRDTSADARKDKARKGKVVASSSTNTLGIDAPLKQKDEQKPDDMAFYADAMKDVIGAISSKQYMAVRSAFDTNGLDVYDKILNYGIPKIIGTPNLTFFKGNDGTVTARGLQMSFSFSVQKKATFIEDIVFTFSKEKKITNVAFGLGKVAENDILYREHATWKPEAVEAVMEFLENYKTAYCLKRFDYINSIFDENATIIIGNVKWNPGGKLVTDDVKKENFGHEEVVYHRYTKEQYMANLRKCFNNPRNKYINVRFANNDVQPLEKFEGKQIFGIQIAQEYNSATYSDKGYLFLMVDMTDYDNPLIKVRTWQPGKTKTEDLINAGWFY